MWDGEEGFPSRGGSGMGNSVSKGVEAGMSLTCVRCIEGIHNLVGMIKIIWGAV